MIDRDNRTFICSVVYYDIVDYSTKSVEVQIRLKNQLNRLTTEAIKNVAINDRIILDTGDGAAICFLGDPEDALFVSMSLRDAILNANDQFTEDPLRVRFGINLGPVKLVKDINNQKNIIGDGVNVGQRVMSFAEPGQILVSRSYYEVVSCLTQEYAKLFHYIGMRADKHIRKHEIYSILRISDPVKPVSLTEPSHPEGAPVQEPIAYAGAETGIVSTDPPSVRELNADNDISLPSPAPIAPAQGRQSKRKVYGALIVAIALVVVISFALQKNFKGRGALPENAPLLPTAHMISPDKSPPETLPTPEKIISQQSETATPEPTLQNAMTPQESPDSAMPESTQPEENETSEKPLQPQTTPIPNATIQFAVTPWGEVYVDGKRKGTSPPLTSVTIAPGKHKVEIKNTSLPPYSQTHEIKPNEKLRISHKF